MADKREIIWMIVALAVLFFFIFLASLGSSVLSIDSFIDNKNETRIIIDSGNETLQINIKLGANVTAANVSINNDGNGSVIFQVENLIAWYRFDDDNETGNSVADATGRNNGTQMVNRTGEHSKFGKQFFYNLTEGKSVVFVPELSNITDMVQNYGLTFNMWFNYTEQADLTFVPVFEMSNPTGKINLRFSEGGAEPIDDINNVITLENNSSAITIPQDGNARIFRNESYMLTYILNQTGWFLYLSNYTGTQIIGNDSWDAVIPLQEDSSDFMTIGATDYSAISGRFLTGNIDEFAMWNTSLHPDNISYLANSGAGRSNETYDLSLEVGIIDGEYEFLSSGQYATQSNVTDISLSLNEALGNGSCSGGVINGTSCTINLTFSSSNYGLINISDIIIQIESNSSPQIEIVRPLSFLSNNDDIVLNITTGIPTGFACSSANFTVINTADQFLEAQDSISDCSQTLFDVSGQGIYNLTVTVNDTSGNENTTSKTFTVGQAPGGGTPGGNIGGGGGVIIIGQDAQWSMETEAGGQKYELQMTQGNIRTKPLFFENLGTQSVILSMDCEGDLCQYIEFDDKTVTLPVGLDIKTRIDFTIDLPAEIASGQYVTNLIATDQESNKGIITTEVNIGTFGLFGEILTKLVSSRELFGIAIPYFLISLIITVFAFLVLNFLLLRPLKATGFALSVILAFIIGFFALFFI